MSFCGQHQQLCCFQGMPLQEPRQPGWPSSPAQMVLMSFITPEQNHPQKLPRFGFFSEMPYSCGGTAIVWEQQWTAQEYLCTKFNSGKQAPVGIAGFQLQEVQKVQSRTKGKIQLVSVGAESGPSWGKGISGNSLQREVCTGKQSCFTGNLTHALEPVRSERPNKTRICWFFFFLFGCWVILLSPYSHPPHCKN